MWQDKKVSVVFPAYNEEKNIRRAVEDFFNSGYVDEIIVVDNNSTDRTAEEVAVTSARLVKEEKQGYGNALRRGLKEASGDLIFTAEPDGTFLGKDVLKLLAYSDDFDAVFGTRTSKELIWKGANMGNFLKWGNWAVAKMMEFLFGGPSLTDVGCTLKLISRPALEEIQGHFRVGGSAFSPEMMLLTILHRFRIIEVPVNYKSRIGESKITGDFTKAFRLGIKMILLIMRYRLTSRKVKVPKA